MLTKELESFLDLKIDTKIESNTYGANRYEPTIVSYRSPIVKAFQRSA